MTALFQVGVLSAFLQGVYESTFTFESLKKKGDFGLGVLNHLDGEMVAVDEKFYRIDAKGTAHLVSPDDCTPFAAVTHFKQHDAFEVHNISSMTALNSLLDTHLPTKNIFYMIRIEAELAWIKLRSEGCQKPPYQPLAETLPNIQHSFELGQSHGTLVATYCPAYSAALTIPGFHYHYIDKARVTGGHVFDLEITKARVMIQPIREFNMALIETKAFDNASCDVNITSALRKIE